jgi:CheY-like chemotaxis protein
MAHILLVEDNDMNRDMLARYLRWEGYEVKIAVNGVQAIEMATSDRPLGSSRPTPIPTASRSSR